MNASVTDVVVADDQAMIRGGLVALLSAEPDLRVLAEAADGEAAVAAVKRRRPDVVLMDVRMPGTDGIAAAREIITITEAQTSVIMLTVYDLDEYVYAALRAGASGFLLKDAPPEELVKAVRTVASGEALLAPSVTRRLLQRFADLGIRDCSTELASLTERECDVLLEVARGGSNAEIARNLGLAELTVKSHLYHVMQKLHLNSRTQLVIMAYETGLVSPGQAVLTGEDGSSGRSPVRDRSTGPASA
ncbi:LuxR family two component transcriptional regulator [Halopolyspora algeriensis]|uniref:LuxR family two component transcriptional regulator n=1 Tax=Halopolyspora algeriensis TaxID=1500506 RepID=A0A368VSJ1_9ACTN|nr:response regulator transcription factor [Halopolyspora algeriensis]RCW43942.1 LuxR family two component transcriptional regulator [Halopolyspora algeriensis]TQM53555.1 LuxR family two component transcriptional regulator [Halopolyspora algeriensis]